MTSHVLTKTPQDDKTRRPVSFSLILEHRGIRSSPDADAMIESDLARLQEQVTIEEAHVHLQCDEEAALPYRVNIHVVTPGPDLRVEGQDHTLNAAVLKAMNELRRRLSVKAARRVARTKSNLRQRAVHGPRN